jgi:hypothetical protein
MPKLELIAALDRNRTVWTKDREFKALFHIFVVNDSPAAFGNYENFFKGAQPMDRRFQYRHLDSPEELLFLGSAVPQLRFHQAGQFFV